MDTRLLTHFLAVYDHRHFGRAAAALDMSKPGISKSIAKLEETIGARLFERGRSGVTPSEFGEALASHARLILAETRIAEDEIEGLKNAETGEVRIGVTPIFSSKILPKAVSSFREKTHKAKVSVLSRFPTELMEMLVHGQLDVVAGSFRPEIEIPETINKEILFTRNAAIVCSKNHPILKKRKGKRSEIKLADIEPYSWLVPSRFNWVANKVTGIFQSAGFSGNRDFVFSDDYNFMRGLLAESDLLSYGNKYTFGWEIDNGLLRDFYVPELSDTRVAMLLTRNNSVLTRAAIRLIQEIREIAKTLESP